MGLILLVVACAALAGRACGGRLARLGDGPVRGWRLLAIGLLVEVLAVATGAVGGLGPPAAVNGVALVLGGVPVALFCLANRSVQGVGLVGLGLLCNVLVVGVNGAMPVSRHALGRAGAPASELGASGPGQVRHTPADRRTTLRPLGDVVPVPLPAHREVDSVGDLLVAAGAAQFVLAGMLRRAGLPRPVPHPAGGPGGWPAERSRTRAGRPQRVSTRATPGTVRSYRERGGVADADSKLVRVITGPPVGRPDPD